MPNSNTKSSATTEAAAACARERLSQIELQDHLEIAFMEGVVWAKEQELERLRTLTKEVTNASN